MAEQDDTTTEAVTDAPETAAADAPETETAGEVRGRR